jgi:3-isopropylmalate/(R)-2-methylmalate dehydratase small subunit
MDKISQINGTGVPLRRSNVDTDQIIPAVFLKRVTKTGFDDALFANWRQDPEFILNQPAYANARVLVVGPDFGTGSQAVIGSRFGEIFRGNAGKQGLLVAIIEEPQVEQIWEYLEAEPGAAVTVDLEAQLVRAGELEFGFEIDPYMRWRLLEGLDDIGLTLRDESAIDEFEKTRPSWMPRTLPALGETEPGIPAITEATGGNRA